MQDINTKVDNYFSLVNRTLCNLDRKSIEKFVDMLLETYDKNGTIFVFGNGGSGATASHFCGDFVKGASYGRNKRFKVLCLNDNNPSHMAIANDVSYGDIFVEQLKNFATNNDLIIGISGSGNSENVVKAMDYAKKIGAKTVALCGYSGGKIKQLSDLSVHAAIDNMEVSEDIHMIITHCVKNLVISHLNTREQDEQRKN